MSPSPAFARSATLWIAAPLVLVLGVAAGARLAFRIPWAELLGDPAAALNSPFYIGFVSSVGIVLWAAAAAIFLFSYVACRQAAHDPEVARFLLCSGLFVALLGLDDLFLLHEQALPLLGIPQLLVLAGYGTLALAYFARFAAVLAAGAYPLLVAAIALLGASAALDQLPFSFTGRPFFEDGAKLLGIGAWLSYAVHFCAAALRSPGLRRSD